MTRAKRPDLVRLYQAEVRRAKVAGRLLDGAAVDVAVGYLLAEAMADPDVSASTLPRLADALLLVRERIGTAPVAERVDDLDAFLRDLTAGAGVDAPASP